MKNSRSLALLLLIVLASLNTPAPPSAAYQQAPPHDESQASPEAKEKLRQLRAQQKTYLVGYSSAMEHKLAAMNGIEIPRGEARRAKTIRAEAQRWLAKKSQMYADVLKYYPDLKLPHLELQQKIRDDVQKANPGQQLPATWRALIPFIPQFSWRNYAAPGIKYQGQCNSCWAVASITVHEYRMYLNATLSAHFQLSALPDLKKAPPKGATVLSDWAVTRDGVCRELRDQAGVKKKECQPMPGLIELATAPLPNTEGWEQGMLDCIGTREYDSSPGWHSFLSRIFTRRRVGTQKYDCSPGWHGTALNYMIRPPARAANKPGCYFAGTSLTWDYVSYSFDVIPPVAQLKEALLEHGPLVSLVCADNAFEAYKGGVFNERNKSQVTHAVVIVGWDDSKRAWLIQNSYGEQWGEQGFMWIEWDSNSIGKYAAWLE